MELTFTVVLREAPEGGFTVLVPTLPEIVSYGRTFAEAQRTAADAIRCVLVGLQQDGAPIPEKEPVISIPEEERTGPLYICRVSSAPLDGVLAHA